MKGNHESEELMGKRGRPKNTFNEKLERCDLGILALKPEDVPDIPTVTELSAFYESILTGDWIGQAKNAALFFVASSLHGHEEIRLRTGKLLERCADSETFDNYLVAEELGRELDRYLEDWPISFIVWCWEEYAKGGLINNLSWKPETLAKMCRARLGRGEGDPALLETVASALDKLQEVVSKRCEERSTKATAKQGTGPRNPGVGDAFIHV